MGAVVPGKPLGTPQYNIHVGSNKTKQHTAVGRLGSEGFWDGFTGGGFRVGRHFGNAG
jgi:hypothetical protein